jgi:hypothetical protein
MKRFAPKLLVALFLLLPCSQTIAVAIEDDGPSLVPVKPNPNPNPNPDPNPIGPRCRARARFVEVEPQCYYYDGEVIIQAGNTVSYITAEIIRAEDNMIWSDAGAGSTITLTVTSDPGTYYLYFTLSNGKSYIGKYILY